MFEHAFLGQIPLRLGQEEPTIPLPTSRLLRDVLTEAQRQDLAMKLRRVWTEKPDCLGPPEKLHPMSEMDMVTAKIISGEERWSDDWPPLIAKIETCYAALPKPGIPTWAWVVGGLAAAGIVTYVATR